LDSPKADLPNVSSEAKVDDHNVEVIGLNGGKSWKRWAMLTSAWGSKAIWMLIGLES